MLRNTQIHHLIGMMPSNPNSYFHSPLAFAKSSASDCSDALKGIALAATAVTAQKHANIIRKHIFPCPLARYTLQLIEMDTAARLFIFNKIETAITAMTEILYRHRLLMLCCPILTIDNYVVMSYHSLT